MAFYIIAPFVLLAVVLIPIILYTRQTKAGRKAIDAGSDQEVNDIETSEDCSEACLPTIDGPDDTTDSETRHVPIQQTRMAAWIHLALSPLAITMSLAVLYVFNMMFEIGFNIFICFIIILGVPLANLQKLSPSWLIVPIAMLYTTVLKSDISHGIEHLTIPGLAMVITVSVIPSALTHFLARGMSNKLGHHITWPKSNLDTAARSTTVIRNDIVFERLLSLTDGRAQQFASTSGDFWTCVCGCKNDLLPDKKIQNCSECHINRDYALENYTCEALTRKVDKPET